MADRANLTDWNNLTPAEVERCIGIVEAIGMDFDRGAYEAARAVDAELPPWELFEPALKRHPGWPELFDAIVDESFALTGPDGDVWKLSATATRAGGLHFDFAGHAMIDGALYSIFGAGVLDTHGPPSHAPSPQVHVWPARSAAPGANVTRRVTDQAKAKAALLLECDGAAAIFRTALTVASLPIDETSQVYAANPLALADVDEPGSASPF